MTWFLYALLTAALLAAHFLVCRSLLRREEDYKTFLLFNEFVPLLFLIPLFPVAEPLRLPDGWVGWALALLSALLCAVQQFVSMRSHRYVEASAREQLNQTKLVWVALLAFLLLGERFTPAKIVATLLILAGALVITYRGRSVSLASEGARLVLASAFLLAVVAIVDRSALAHFSPTFYSVLLFALVGVFVLAATRPSLGKVGAFFLRYKALIVLATFFGAFSYWFEIKALSEGAASDVVPVFQLTIVFTTLGGIVFLGERSELVKKIVGAALAFAGAVMLAGAV